MPSPCLVCHQNNCIKLENKYVNIADSTELNQNVCENVFDLANGLRQCVRQTQISVCLIYVPKTTHQCDSCTFHSHTNK